MVVFQSAGRRCGATLAAIAVLAVATLLAPGHARAAAPPRITAGPVIDGTPQVDAVLAASATWTGDPPPTATWTWERCVRGRGRCSEIAGATAATYRVDAGDVGATLRVRLRVTSSAGAREQRSANTAAVTPAPAQPPAPAPAPPPPAPPPPPPPPVAAVPPAPAPPRLLDPFPVVRIKGLLSARGARVTLFRVSAPRGARVTVVCHGRGCPRHRFAPPPGTARLHPFERDLRAGTRLEVRVTKAGFVGKLTVIVIRRHASPRRSDQCLAPGTTKAERCPAG